MKKCVDDIREGHPLLDVVSFGRPRPGHAGSLTKAEIAYVARTVQRVPEVMTKGLGWGS